MPLKIISGVLIPNSATRSGDKGTATIDLSNGMLQAGATAEFAERAVIGSGAFISQPAKHIALRKIRLLDTAPPGSATVPLRLDIDDSLKPTKTNPTTLTVTWQTNIRSSSDPDTRFVEIHEISVLIIGEVA